MTAIAREEPLRLRFEDAEDLAALSIHVQDAILRVGDMRHEPAQRRFGLMLNRFRWERAGGGRFRLRPDERVHAVLHFDGVLAVKAVGIPQARKEDLLVLLAVTFTPGELPAGEVRLDFAGGACLSLTVECLEGALIDQGEPWTTPNRPRHQV
jgi:hypothetical protein